MMTSNLWSWIFIIQMFSIRPCYSLVIKHSNDFVPRQVIQDIFIRNLSRAEKTRRTFIGLAIGLSLVLFAGMLGLFLYIRQQRQKNAVVDPETTAVTSTTAVEKPNWWMVEGKNEKMDWWRLSFQGSALRDPEDRSRIERLKAALKIKHNKNQPILPTHKAEISPADTINLPIQPIPSVQPQYPDALEKSYRAPVYPTQYVPLVPAFDIKPLKQNPNLPPELYISPKLTRSSLARANAERRTGVPRSPANKRRSFLSRHHLRHPHPFIPLKDSDARLITISAPMPVDPSKLSHPKLAPVNLDQSRAAPKGPRRSSLKGSKGSRPPPLNLGNDNTQPPPRRVRFGLSPRYNRE
jgi:hypothetical protein